VTEVTVTLGVQQLYHSTSRFFQDTVTASAANLAVGQYDLKVETSNDFGQQFVRSGQRLPAVDRTRVSASRPDRTDRPDRYRKQHVNN